MAPDSSDQQVPLPPDVELLTLFHSNPEYAWRVFVDRYADLIFSQLHHLGFDYDQAMDRFVYIFEKLAENDFRRLKSIRYAGRSGDLTPWVRHVVKNLSVNWAWSESGRKRLLKPIAELPEFEQRVFQLYFWGGMSPHAIHEQLRAESFTKTSLTDVLEALEHIMSSLSQKKLWRLLSNLARARGTISIDDLNEETERGIDPPDDRASPEEVLIQKESEKQLSAALACLLPRERLVTQLRFEEGMAIKDIALMLHLSEYEARKILKAALAKLRQEYKVEPNTILSVDNRSGGYETD